LLLLLLLLVQTLVNNLLRSYCTSGTVTVAHDGSKTSLAAFKSDPSQLCYQLEPMTIETVGRQLIIKIQVGSGVWVDPLAHRGVGFGMAGRDWWSG
jgi:hypothetical protein